MEGITADSIDTNLLVYDHVIQRKVDDMIALRLKPEDEKAIREYAEFNKISVSEFMRQSAIDRIETEYDLDVIREYENRKANGDVEFFDHDKVWGELT